MTIPQIRSAARDATTVTFSCQDTPEGKRCTHLTMQRAAEDAVYLELTRDTAPAPMRQRWLIRKLPMPKDPKATLYVTADPSAAALHLHYPKHPKDPEQPRGRITIHTRDSATPPKTPYADGEKLVTGLKEFSRAVDNIQRCVEHGTNCSSDYFTGNAHQLHVAELRAAPTGVVYTLSKGSREQVVAAAKEFPKRLAAFRDHVTRFEKTPHICKMSNQRMQHELSTFWKGLGVTKTVKQMRKLCMQHFAPHTITTGQLWEQGAQWLLSAR